MLPPFCERKFGPAHGGELQARDKQRSKQCRCIAADAALAEVHEQDFAFVEDASQVEAILGLADEIAQKRGADKVADFVLDRSNSLGLEFWVHPCKFVEP